MKRGLTRKEREVTDMNEIIKILDKCKILRLGLVDGDEPYIVPMNYGYTMENGELTLYLHCAPVGRKLDIIRVNPKVFFEMDCDVVPLEGKVPCQYGTAYSSLMGSGRAEIIEDTESKKRMLSIFMKTQTGKDFEFTDKLVTIVSIIKIKVSDYTAKSRPLPPMMHGKE